jgi:hypothetical protein
MAVLLGGQAPAALSLLRNTVINDGESGGVGKVT